jgi:hypothetical protein
MLHAKTALELQPNHGEAKQLLATLERMRQGPASKTIKTVAVAAPAPRAVEPPPAVDVSAATLVAFTSKVQPILMNTCVSCHANETGGKFRLERVYESGRSASSQRNLAAVLEHVDLERPTISTLLVKAITPHGREAGAPLKDRAGAPFQAIQQWIVDAVRTNPQLKEYRAARNPAPVKKTPEEKPSTFSSQGSLAPTGDDVSRPLERRAVKAAPQAQATRTPQTARERDWCHEDIFNEWAHPQRFAPQTAQAGTR